MECRKANSRFVLPRSTDGLNGEPIGHIRPIDLNLPSVFQHQGISSNHKIMANIEAKAARRITPEARRQAAGATHVHERLGTRTDLSENATRDIAAALNGLLADTFALYLKTKNFHWHMSGPHFRDYHLLLDEQSEQIFAMTDPLAERVRKLGRNTLHSIGEIARNQRILDNDAEYVAPDSMLAELQEDNQQVAKRMRETHATCDDHGDVATASLLETWIDEAERRNWFLFEATRRHA